MLDAFTTSGCPVCKLYLTRGMEGHHEARHRKNHPAQ